MVRRWPNSLMSLVLMQITISVPDLAPSLSALSSFLNDFKNLPSKLSGEF